MVIKNISGHGPMMHLEGTTFIKPIDGYRFYAGPEHTQDLTESDIREVMQNWRQYAIANPVHHFDLAIGAAYLEAWLDGREYCGVYDRLLGDRKTFQTDRSV